MSDFRMKRNQTAKFQKDIKAHHNEFPKASDYNTVRFLKKLGSYTR